MAGDFYPVWEHFFNLNTLSGSKITIVVLSESKDLEIVYPFGSIFAEKVPGLGARMVKMIPCPAAHTRYRKYRSASPGSNTFYNCIYEVWNIEWTVHDQLPFSNQQYSSTLLISPQSARFTFADLVVISSLFILSDNFMCDKRHMNI